MPAETRRKNEPLKNLLRAALPVGLACLLAMNFACGGNASLQKKSNANAVPPVKLTAVERDIKSVQMASFEYIFVFRRKDGAAFTPEDRTFLKNTSPPETNRFLLSDEDKAVIAGSSYKFEPEVLEKLGERFDIENFSAPESSETNGNVNANQANNVNQANTDKNINK